MDDVVRESFDSPPSGHGSCFNAVAGKTPESKVFPAGDRKAVPRLLVSVSAKDLASLDMGKENEEWFSPRGVLEDCLRSIETRTGSSKASTSGAEIQPRATSHWQGLCRLLKARTLKRFYSFPSVSVLSRRKGRRVRENQRQIINPPGEYDFCYLKPSWRNFTLSELQIATNNFSSENLIGKGGYAEVYKGCLQNGQLIAIKRLTRGTSEERTAAFLSELGIIVHVNHPNTAKLIGYGVEGGMHLVLELSPHGSLSSLLHGSEEKLEWGIRYKIALGSAEGLLYLHEICQKRIIHRDIKAANILLTQDFEPQICDFGLSKWLPGQWTHRTVSKFEGTFGYLAPEYFMHGIVDEKTDVFAFGVLLLELITGRRALDNSQQSLVMWAKPLIDRNDTMELVDPSLANDYDPLLMSHAISTASLCTQNSSLLRPRMSQVVQLLRGDEGISKSSKQCQRPSHQRTYSEELHDAEEYNSTRYLNDLTRHKQIALEF
ncbi:receptor-like cytosolic serine/threonine-protein kinase RBK2 isoform X2 [Telopea speciosissima]|uniref:receptor-like cytosolic serine/threonine-protein kinase RBK2 isoform X1 n=1 Tax=Telopea speciosissima TaxID=54955 RepID=UPI001CC76647|nr:receptor-like cytosolic serine/threonine-protein kinase RBK2 isoform X1 [Telopea speciosissima]XP_043708327.1 receptor-like cytosolic serine/threonine-protein kinase RBK2 isoform X2 [Telopea speciosissima]